MIKTAEELEAYIRRQDNMYLYGAGRRAKRFLGIFQVQEIVFDGCIVSERGENPSMLGDIPVYALEELKGQGKKISDLNVLVSIAGTMEKLFPIFEKLPTFKSVLFFSEELEDDINHKWRVKYEFEKRQSAYELEIACPRAESGMGMLKDRRTGEYLMRVPYYLGMGMLEPILESGARSTYEQNFGTLTVLPRVEKSGITPDVAECEKIQIYVANSHMDKSGMQGGMPGGYIPLQVGAALTDVRKGCLTDDTGDHISAKNRDYCECTGLYWIWKNTFGQQYVGLSHYRRRLMLDDAGLRFIKEQNIDIVPTLPQYEIVPVKEFFEGFIEGNDWHLLKKFVSLYDVEYAECFERYEAGHFYFPCNVMLWKRKWFDRYCEFAFSIAEQIEQTYKRVGVYREDRYMGYLFEQLSSLFIMRHRNELKVACAEMEWMQS